MARIGRLHVVVDDITTLAVDAIVNAANQRLLGGGGVDGAIHRAAGTSLVEACRRIPEVRPGVRCPMGEARITPGFDLPARWVIHTVGPVWNGGCDGEPELLIACYDSCLRLAAEQRDITSIAFPAISTGAFGFPPGRAAELAVKTVTDWVASNTTPHRIIFCCFDDGAAEAYHRAMG